VRTVFVGPAPRIALSVAGAGPLVVCLHGIGGHRQHWDDQLRALGAHFTAAAWDARGYGDSDDYAGPLAFADFSADLLRVLDFFGAARAHLVGLSLGGRIARDFALRHPGRVATLVLANTSAGFDTLAPAEVEAFVRSRRGPLEAGRTSAELAHELARNLVSPSAVPGAYERLLAAMAALHKDSYLKTIEASAREDRGARIESIAAPTLVVTSDGDRLYPPALAEAMAHRIPGARLALIRGAGHLSNLEQPEAFDAAVRGFLLEHRARADDAHLPKQ
jgi:3-oxoadipate enol-lactonase